MKKNFPYKVGDNIKIYKDWENEKELLGTALLVKCHKQGRSFILEEAPAEHLQVVYNYQEWIVKFDGRNHTDRVKIRYIDTIGISKSAVEEDHEDFIKNLPEDKFLEVDGVEIY